MNLTNILAILSTIGQLPTAALVAITCVLGGIGIGIGTAFRDVPKYSCETIRVILNFILSVKEKEQIDVPPEPKEETEKCNARNRIKVIEGGKNEKKENQHKDGHAN